MAEIWKQYIRETERQIYGSRVGRPKIEDKDNFELKGQFLKELRTNTFSGSDHEDANEHIEKVLEIMDLFHIPNITIDQVMLKAFPMSFTGASSRWLRNKPTGSFLQPGKIKDYVLRIYCPTCSYCKENGRNQQLSTRAGQKYLYQAWERFKELLMKCPQHYLTEMQEVVLFYNGLVVQFDKFLISKRAIQQQWETSNGNQKGASVSVMPLSTYFNLGLGEFAYTKLTVELADKTVKYPKGIAKNVLVGTGKFTFPIDFIILDMPEDIKVPLILGRPFSSTARAKIDVYKRKITLRVREERRNQGDDLMPTIEEDFAVLENMDAYRDEGMGDVIFGDPFLREVGIKAR
ncbi:putative reverse transcriptase domain-containing protein [Tanacetum coccineum]